MFKKAHYFLCYSTQHSKFDPTKNYYDALNIKKNSSSSEIRKSYLKLVKKYHPDLNPSGKERFTLVQEAYKVLANQSERKNYDEFYSQYICPEPKSFKEKPKAKINPTEYPFYSRKAENENFYDQNFSFRSQKRSKFDSDVKKNYFEDLIKNREKWRKEFTKEFDGKENIRKNEKEKENFKEQEYAKMQFSFSKKNPFVHNINSPVESCTRWENIVDRGLKNAWDQLRNKIWK